MTRASLRPSRRHRDAEAGVSSVLGAILVFGLLIITLTVVQVEFVPTWQEEREARHAEHLATQVAQLVSDLQRLATNQTTATLTDGLDLKAGSTFTFFGGDAREPGSVAFTPDATPGLAITSPLARLRSQNGVPLFGLDSSWTNYDNTTSNVRSNVTSVDFLRLRVTNFTKLQTHDVFTAALTITNNGTTHGTFRTIVTRETSETAITIHVLDRNGTAIHESAESFFNNAPLNATYVNALSDDFLFAALLNRAPAPYTITFTTDAPPGIFDAQYLFAGTELTADGGSQTVGNLGLPVANFSSSLPSGSLRIATNHQRLPAQAFVVEHGAVLMEQDGAAVIRVPPALAFSTSGGQTQMRWSLPALAGSLGGVSGTDAASLAISPGGNRNDVVGTAANLVVRIPTAHPAAWTSWLDGQLRSAGLSQPLGHYTLSNTTTQVTLALAGASNLATLEDLYFSVQQANVLLATTASG